MKTSYVKMDMHSKKEYLKVVREKYWKAGSRKEKTQILNEYCENTKQSRKYVISLMNARINLEGGPRKKRKEIYGSEVKVALAKVWHIFDYPCGQRLKPLLTEEVDRLRELRELPVSEETAEKLKKISSATIDRKLRQEKRVLHLARAKGGPKPAYLLKQKIPLKLTEWDTSEVGYTEADLVVHCGSSMLGEYIHTLSVTEIATGWWEGKAIMGRSQAPILSEAGLKEIRGRTPFVWKGIDSDNGQEFINDQLYRYCKEERVEFTRSRPNKKNDNAYIEQKNWTHVRKVLGYLPDRIGGRIGHYRWPLFW